MASSVIFGTFCERQASVRSSTGTRVPRSSVLQRQPMQMQQRCALAGGDDYELLFTAPSNRRAEVIAAAEATPIRRIGTVTATADLAVLDEQRGAGRHWQRGLRSFLCS